jgi:D-alanyl-D-alanine carboxypeptidase/D-alanyl-D-alanine-endopeptidase (penicillin-binding protein 4)
VWFVGGGDPLLATADYAGHFKHQPQTYTPIEQLADRLAGAGITAIQGQIVGDDSHYDADRYPDDWPERFITQDQSGPLSALTVNDGYQSYPPSPDVHEPDEEPADDPPAHAAGVLRDLLTARNVTVDPTVSSGTAPTTATVELASIESPPVSEIVGEMLRESDNQTGELLLKAIAVARGRPGTTVDGAAVARAVVDEVGLPSTGEVVQDGSGLGSGNLLSCTLVDAILDRAGPDSPIGQGLALGGQSGTLSERFTDPAVTGRVHAKTGTLNQTTALAGFVDTTPGAKLTFSFIVNTSGDLHVGQADLDRQEELAAILVRYPEGPALDDLSPVPVP